MGCGLGWAGLAQSDQLRFSELSSSRGQAAALRRRASDGAFTFAHVTSQQPGDWRHCGHPAVRLWVMSGVARRLLCCLYSVSRCGRLGWAGLAGLGCIISRCCVVVIARHRSWGRPLSSLLPPAQLRVMLYNPLMKYNCSCCSYSYCVAILCYSVAIAW